MSNFFAARHISRRFCSDGTRPPSAFLRSTSEFGGKVSPTDLRRCSSSVLSALPSSTATDRPRNAATPSEHERMKFPAAAVALTFALASTSSRISTPAHSFSLNMMSTQASSSARTNSRAAVGSKDASDDGGGGGRHPLDPIGRNFDNSWLGQLDPEDPSNRIKSLSYARGPENEDSLNRASRPVFNGHFVEVAPTPLRNPRLVLYSSDVAERLGLTEEDVTSEEFAKFFSGDVKGAFESHEESGHIDTRTWATPYALSIMGTRQSHNCPFGTGDGYGDGRAISVGEVVVSPEALDGPSSARYELQLKGGGRTPFCRGADGRAVLRSSIREFLASEAMHHLGVKTTRALSLVVSDGPNGNTSRRPWYSGDNKRTLPSMDDPRLARFSDEQKRQLLSQLAVQSRGDPDVMIMEPNAITCRVAPSFVRIGHLDLFSRRATKEMKSDGSGPKLDPSTPEWRELEKMIWHAAFREFPAAAYDPFHEKDDIVGAAKTLLNESMEAISTMIGGWIKVGFAQGNFNADNCLVGGRTMDYGPFGFVDEYNPLFAKWTGSGEHFGFLNQPQAGFANYAILVESVMPVIYEKLGEEEGEKVQSEIMEKAQETFQRKMDEVFRLKLGFDTDDAAADPVWETVEKLLRESRADYTMFWRRLTEVASEFPTLSSEAYGDMLDLLCGSDEVREGSSPFHEPLDAEYRSKFLKWIQMWRETLKLSDSSSSGDNNEVAERMRKNNPKYVLREWMLVDAYSKASKGDEYMIAELLELVQRPYDEGTEEQEKRYYRRAPDEALQAGGTAYMS